MTDRPAFDVVRYPKSRYATFDMGRIALGRHQVACLLEVDVTTVRRRLKDAKTAGRRVSFTGLLLKCVAQAVARHPPAHALRSKPGESIQFRDVDIATVVERDVEGTKVPLAMVVRAVSGKSAEAITAELEAARSRVIGHEGNYVVGGRFSRSLMRLYYALPQPVRGPRPGPRRRRHRGARRLS